MAKKKDYSNMYLLGMVACVAIVALVVLVMNTGTNTMSLSEEDMSGQAIDGKFDGSNLPGSGGGFITDADGDGVKSAGDCDDNDASVGAAETYYYDSDGDGFGGDTGSYYYDTEQYCPDESVPSYHVDNDEDCDDANSAINPDATEFCDGFDNDCDNNIDGPRCSNMDLSIEDAEALLTFTSARAEGRPVYEMTLYIDVVNNDNLDDAQIGTYILLFPDYPSYLMELNGDITDNIGPGETYVLEESFSVYVSSGVYDLIVADGYIDVDVTVDFFDELEEADETNNQETVRAYLR